MKTPIIDKMAKIEEYLQDIKKYESENKSF